MKHLFTILFLLTASIGYSQSFKVEEVINSSKHLKKDQMKEFIASTQKKNKIFSVNQTTQSDNYSWDMVVNDWRFEYRYKIQFTTSGKLSVFEYLDTTLIVQMRQVNEYNQNDSLYSVTQQTREDGKLFYTYRDFYYYDSIGRIIRYETQSFDTSANTWVDILRASIFYNSAGYDTLFKSEVYDSGIWITTSGRKSVYYTTNNRIDTVLVYDYNMDIDTYEPFLKYTFQFNNNLTTKSYIYIFNKTQNKWNLDNGMNWYYNNSTEPNRMEYLISNNSVIYVNYSLDSIIWHKWNGANYNSQEHNVAYYILNSYIDTTNILYPVFKYNKTYKDNYGSYNITEYLRINNTWNNYRNVNVNYDTQRNLIFSESTELDSNGNLSYYTSEKILYTYNNNQIMQKIDQYFDQSTNTYVNYLKTVYSYFTGIESTNKNNIFSLYPNPSSGEIFIKLNNNTLTSDDTNLRVLDLYGREIINTKIKDLEKIKIENQGIYFVEVQGAVEKIIVR